MELSQQTQLDMYSYIYSGKRSSLKITDGNAKDFILNEIKNKVYTTDNLFVCVPISEYSREKIRITRNYNSISNMFLYSALKEIGIFDSILDDYEHCNLEFSQQLIDDSDNVIVHGKSERDELIQLCKMYLLHQQLERTSKKKEADTTGEIDIESRLAELALHKYSKYLKPFRVAPKTVKDAEGFAQSLVTDIILESPTANKSLIVDVKVYKDFIVKHHNKSRYKSNENRFQLNSYIGAYLDNHANMEVVGILLHIVSPEHWERVKEHQGAKLTIETNRPIRLYIIPDFGLDYIFNSYKKIIQSYL